MTNKIMDNQPKRQQKQDNESQQQQSLLSQSRTSGGKKVGTIVSRRRSNTQAGEHSSLSSRANNNNSDNNNNKLPTPQPQPITYIQPAPLKINKDSLIRSGMINIDNHGRFLGMGGQVNKIVRHHVRSKSYQQQREDLERELVQLTLRKNQIEELRQNKKNLKVKLNQLELELKQIKNNRYTSRMNNMQSNQNTSKIQTLKKLKHPKLKPIKLRQNTQPQHSLQSPQPPTQPIQTQIKNLKKQPKKHFRRHYTQSNNNQSSSQQQLTNYYYQGQLHHKCLNCKHYQIKKQDVGIPSQVKNDFNL